MFSEYLHFELSSDCRDEARFLSKDIIWLLNIYVLNKKKVMYITLLFDYLEYTFHCCSNYSFKASVVSLQ